jgi:hypothetical protein
MNYIFCLQSATRGDYSLARRQPPYLFPDFAALLHNSRPARTMDCPIHAATPHKAGISSVDDSIGGLPGDITLNQR